MWPSRSRSGGIILFSDFYIIRKQKERVISWVDLEKKKSKLAPNPLKIMFRVLETKKKFQFFCPIPYTWYGDG